jgi:NAD-dependent dihydropyrimidine dehydrogenase PreA subunit
MTSNDVFTKLAEKFDDGQIVGAPMTPSLLKILMLLFTPDEAAVALKLPFQNTPLEEAKSLYPEHGDGIETVLDNMAGRGTVFRDNKPGIGKRYRLLPSLVGWAETPIWHGKPTQQARDLSPLWKQYHKEAFAAEMARGKPLMRVIPVNTSLQDPSQVLSFDELQPIVARASFRAVAHCPCRLQAGCRGEPCDHSTENCLHFGSMGRYMVEHGLAREISADETLVILKAADDEGLVHIIDNMDGYMSTICNCCGCCCSFIRPISENWGLEMLSQSNYVAGVDEAACMACGACEERCPVGAITVQEELAGVDASRCLGCGACTPTCDAAAVRLVLREEVKPPPAPVEFLEARMKSIS